VITVGPLDVIIPSRPRRRRLLERGRLPRGERSGPTRAAGRDRQELEAAPGSPRPPAPGQDPGRAVGDRADGAAVAHQARPGPLPPPGPDRRAGVRPGEGGPRVPALRAAWASGLHRRVAAHVRDPQPAQAMAERPSPPGQTSRATAATAPQREIDRQAQDRLSLAGGSTSHRPISRGRRQPARRGVSATGS
jgi:hypothetical protein